jgi:hypothetical protein
MVDDADNAGIDWRFGRIEREAGFLAADEKHFFADAGADTVDRDERPPRRLAVRGERLDEQQLDPDQMLVFPCRHNGANDPGKLHIVMG